MQCKICVMSHFSGRGDSHQLHNMNQMAAKRVCVCVLGRCGELYGEGQTSRAASFGREKQGFAVQRRKSEFTFTFLFLSWDLSSLSFINLSEAVRQILYCNVECRLAGNCSLLHRGGKRRRRERILWWLLDRASGWTHFRHPVSTCHRSLLFTCVFPLRRN